MALVRIDNSMSKMFHFCPAAFQERYLHQLERTPPAGKSAPTDFGKRMHQLLEVHYQQSSGRWQSTYGPMEPPELELEAQQALAAYRAHYPQEPFSVVDVERQVEVPIPGSSHVYVAKLDMVVRMNDTRGLRVFETKTEGARSSGNRPDAWAARAQVGLYMWAGAQLYGGPFEGILLNVITRSATTSGTNPGMFGAGPYFRRDSLERTEAQQLEAVSNIKWVADQIEQLQRTHGSELLWPQDREQCVRWPGVKCAYYDLHILGRTDETLRGYRKAEQYLKEEGDQL